jgi:serine/threonine protein kinase
LQQQRYHHFDIKLENILIDENLGTYLCDFGSCFKINKENCFESWRLNSTFEYQAPEIIELDLSDLFCFKRF